MRTRPRSSRSSSVSCGSNPFPTIQPRTRLTRMPGRRWAWMAAIVVCLVLGGSAEALAAQRYASPTGAGSTCSSGNPARIVTAFTGQGLGDEIIIAPGDYGSVSQNLFVQMNSYAHGVHGQPPPRIHMAPGRYMATGINSRLSYARIDGDNQVLQVSENGGAD